VRLGAPGRRLSRRDSALNIQVIPARDIDAPILDAWTSLRRSNPELQSPYFAPEFTQAVAAARDDVELATLADHGEIVALFPFQREKSGVGVPVGGILSDYQGLICAPGFECDARQLLRNCRLVAWDFDHLLASQRSFAPSHRAQDPSPQIDLSGGFAWYAAERRAAGSDVVIRSEYYARRLERDMGPLRFVAHEADPARLGDVLDWKSGQYRRTGKPDLFALSWVRAIVGQLHVTQGDTLSGMLSLLYAGDRLIAGHMGMRSRGTWHYWFPAYDSAFAKYSPGQVLLLNMMEWAPANGVRTIDLGKGGAGYKRRLMNASTMVAAGSVELLSMRALKRAAARGLRSAVVRSPLAGPARRLARWARGETADVG
jgi:CelD/BcsL family acetyltransferase involved in cellulose biosynthesis